MKGATHMHRTGAGFQMNWIVTGLLLTVTAVLCAGCSQELASFDDNYVPQSIDENFPIKVVERPVRLSLEATPGGLRTKDANLVIDFARKAATAASTPVTVAYPAGSKLARQSANQAAGILVRQGVSRQAVIVTPKDGGTNEITLAFATKVAVTKPCGDWSQNMRGNQFTESGPNFGCAFQQNFAAMVANPEDLNRPQPSSPATSASQATAIDTYNAGKWTTPTTDTSNIGSSGQ